MLKNVSYGWDPILCVYWLNVPGSAFVNMVLYFYSLCWARFREEFQLQRQKKLFVFASAHVRKKLSHQAVSSSPQSVKTRVCKSVQCRPVRAASPGSRLISESFCGREAGTSHILSRSSSWPINGLSKRPTRVLLLRKTISASYQRLC